MFPVVLRARPATLGDARLLLAWRNDPGTMEHSIVQAPVLENEHAAWLARSIVAPDRWLMIVEEAFSPECVATYRLDGGEESVEVSLTVAPMHRGRGLAVRVIALATEHARELGAARCVARVHERNERPRRAFVRAGYSLSAEKAGEFLLYERALAVMS